MQLFKLLHLTAFILLFTSTTMLTACQPKSSTPAKQFEHSQDGAFNATVSYSGKYSVVSSLYHGVSLWDVENNALKYNWYQTANKETFSVKGANDQSTDVDNNFVFATAISHNDSHALLADNTTFSIWEITSGKNVGYWQTKRSKVVYQTKQVAGRSVQTQLYDVIDANKCENPVGNEVCEITAHIRAVDISNDGKHVLLGKSNGVVVHINLVTGRRIEFMGHQQTLLGEDGDSFHINNAINSVSLSPNGAYALSGSSDHSAYLWDTKTGQVIYKFQHDSRVIQVTLDPKARFAFTADSKKQAIIWDLKTGKKISNLNYVNRQEVFSAARFSKNGEYLVTGAPTRKLSLWRVRDGHQIKEWLVTPRKNTRPSSAVVYSATFINSDKQIVSESSAGLNEVWNIN